jgi:hypothetical protein
MTELWQLQPLDTLTLSLTDIHRLAADVHRVVDRRNRFGRLISWVEVFVFTGLGIASPNLLQRVGCAWTVIGLLFMTAQLRRRPATTPAADLGLAACLEFQRAELMRQRDFHRGSWFWSRFVAFVPGPLVFGFGALRVFPAEKIVVALVMAIFIAIALWAVPLNLRIARVYQRQIDALPH